MWELSEESIDEVCKKVVECVKEIGVDEKQFECSFKAIFCASLYIHIKDVKIFSEGKVWKDLSYGRKTHGGRFDLVVVGNSKCYIIELKGRCHKYMLYENNQFEIEDKLLKYWVSDFRGGKTAFLDDSINNHTLSALFQGLNYDIRKNNKGEGTSIFMKNLRPGIDLGFIGIFFFEGLTENKREASYKLVNGIPDDILNNKFSNCLELVQGRTLLFVLKEFVESRKLRIQNTLLEMEIEKLRNKVLELEGKVHVGKEEAEETEGEI